MSQRYRIKGTRREGKTRERRERRRQVRLAQSTLAGKGKVSRELRGTEGVLVEVALGVNQSKGRRLRQWRKRVRKLLSSVDHRGEGKVVAIGPTSWEEERARVGTGYRVRVVEEQSADSIRLELDLGYGHRKRYRRAPGRQVELRKSGRKLSYRGEQAKEKVMQEVMGLERRRPRSVYTGCGRTRKSRVGKKKLKPTKVRV